MPCLFFFSTGAKSGNSWCLKELTKGGHWHCVDSFRVPLMCGVKHHVLEKSHGSSVKLKFEVSSTELGMKKHTAHVWKYVNKYGFKVKIKHIN